MLDRITTDYDIGRDDVLWVEGDDVHGDLCLSAVARWQPSVAVTSISSMGLDGPRSSSKGRISVGPLTGSMSWSKDLLRNRLLGTGPQCGSVQDRSAY